MFPQRTDIEEETDLSSCRSVLDMAKLQKIVEEILQRYPERFTMDFEHNKRELEKVAVISSKEARNRVAGYIVRYLKKEELSKEGQAY